MGLVAVAVGFAALDAYLGRDLSGATGLVLFIGALACIFGLNLEPVIPSYDERTLLHVAYARPAAAAGPAVPGRLALQRVPVVETARGTERGGAQTRRARPPR